MTKLTDVTGIGPVAAKILSDHCIKTVETLAAISLAELLKVPGFGDIRARAVRKAATDCLRNRASQKSVTVTTSSRSTAGKKAADQKAVASKAVTQAEKETAKEKKHTKKEDKKEKKGKGKDKKKEKKAKNKNKKQKKK